MGRTFELNFSRMTKNGEDTLQAKERANTRVLGGLGTNAIGRRKVCLLVSSIDSFTEHGQRGGIA